MSVDAVVGTDRDEPKLAASRRHPARVLSELARWQIVPAEERERDVRDFHGSSEVLVIDVR